MKRISLNLQILIGCLVGLAAGFWLAGQPASPVVANTLYCAKIVGNLFLDLLRMVLVPLIFSTIAGGVANLPAHDQMHPGWTTAVAFFFLTKAQATPAAYFQQASMASRWPKPWPGAWA